MNHIGFDQLNESRKFFPKNLNFYSIDNPKLICDLNISKFNSAKDKYTTIQRSVLIEFLINKISKEDIFYEHDISNITIKEERKKLSKLSEAS